MKVTKLDAAIRQLMTALELFIEDKDPVSINTLVNNAWEIVETLCKKNDKSIYWKHIQKNFPKMSYKDFRESVHKPRNYAKHANKTDDPESEEYSNADNASLIFAASYDLGRLANSLPIELQVFQIWCLAIYDEPLSETKIVFPSNLKELSEPKQRELLKNTIYAMKQDAKLMADEKTMIWPRPGIREAQENSMAEFDEL